MIEGSLGYGAQGAAEMTFVELPRIFRMGMKEQNSIKRKRYKNDPFFEHNIKFISNPTVLCQDNFF